ncbi:Hypothetical protein, partial CDS, partial [Neorhizobium galegae bv. orientalis]
PCDSPPTPVNHTNTRKKTPFDSQFKCDALAGSRKLPPPEIRESAPKSRFPKARRVTASTAATAWISTKPSTLSTSARRGVSMRKRATRCKLATVAFGTMTSACGHEATAARSASNQNVSAPLIRTTPLPPCWNQLTTFRRASSFPAGATASSRSMMIRCAPEAAAFSICRPDGRARIDSYEDGSSHHCLFPWICFNRRTLLLPASRALPWRRAPIRPGRRGIARRRFQCKGCADEQGRYRPKIEMMESLAGASPPCHPMQQRRDQWSVDNKVRIALRLPRIGCIVVDAVAIGCQGGVTKQ